MTTVTRTELEAWAHKEGLSPAYAQQMSEWLTPLVAEVSVRCAPSRCKNEASPYILGIQGLQGAGKSTTARAVKYLLEHVYELSVVELSIDDFYLTRVERQSLASNIHPLFTTRGVPGTHDVDLCHRVIDDLASMTTPVRVPRFSKHLDDREVLENWTEIRFKPDVIILEGWCVGIEPQVSEDLKHPVNTLESEEDADRNWREYVNQQLADEYQSLFDRLDDLVVLKAPSFDCVMAWRTKQEAALISRLGESNHTMNEAELIRFMAHYERLSRHALNTLDMRASWVFELDIEQAIRALNVPKPATKHVISTDLDATLLDHNSYDWAPAHDAIRRAQFAQSAIVFNTSKTIKESIELQQKMGIEAPIIVENGSAIFDQGQAKVLGAERPVLVKWLRGSKSYQQGLMTIFSDVEADQLADSTGLSFDQAKAALARDYSEPFKWKGNDEDLSMLKERVMAAGYNLLEGGRFYHLLGETDKGGALQELIADYPTNISVVALGDSPNDLAMLNAVDYAVVIHSARVDDIKPTAPRIYRTAATGPIGWAEAIHLYLDEQEANHG